VTEVLIAERRVSMRHLQDLAVGDQGRTSDQTVQSLESQLQKSDLEAVRLQEAFPVLVGVGVFPLWIRLLDRSGISGCKEKCLS